MSNRTDSSVWMWTQARDLMDQVERLQRRFFDLDASQPRGVVWVPPVDVFEDNDEIVIVVAMPGVTAEGVQVEIIGEPGALVVRGERPFPLGDSRHQVRQLEIPYGAFERHIPLPPGPLEVASLEMRRGCLIVHLRKIVQVPR